MFGHWILTLRSLKQQDRDLKQACKPASEWLNKSIMKLWSGLVKAWIKICCVKLASKGHSCLRTQKSRGNSNILTKNISFQV